MARLFDVIKRHFSDKYFHEYHEAIVEAQVILAENVRDYISHMDSDQVFNESLPNIVPPFEYQFVEFSIPSNLHPKVKVGLHTHSMDCTNKRWKDFIIQTSSFDADPLLEEHDCRWVIRSMFFVEDYPQLPHAVIQANVDRQGQLIPYYTKESTFDSPFHIHPVPNGIYWTDKDYYPDRGWRDGVAMCFYIQLWAFSFMNCKNVSMIENIPPEKLSKKHQKRYGSPMSRYYTIGIKPMMGRRSSGDQGGEHHAPSLHIRRGHFKVFTEDKPLFGRHVGTYWWDAAVVGRKEAGQVSKDYEVITP